MKKRIILIAMLTGIMFVGCGNNQSIDKNIKDHEKLNKESSQAAEISGDTEEMSGRTIFNDISNNVNKINIILPDGAKDYCSDRDLIGKVISNLMSVNYTEIPEPYMEGYCEYEFVTDKEKIQLITWSDGISYNSKLYRIKGEKKTEELIDNLLR